MGGGEADGRGIAPTVSDGGAPSTTFLVLRLTQLT
jgi:hypothetical protein